MTKLNLKPADLMLVIMSCAHVGQTDKAGRPYMNHPMYVACLVTERFGDDEDLHCIALGHDLIEDTTITVDYLKDMGFSQRVTDGILALTKQSGEPYDDYKKRVMANKDAVRVKIADLTHNMDLSRLVEVTEKDLERVKKYALFLEQLEATI